MIGSLLSANDRPGEYPPSYYAASAHAIDPFPAAEGDLTADVCIIGGGYTGLSAALHLAERGFDTVLVWVEDPAAEDHLAVGVALPYDLPGHYLEYQGRTSLYGEATPSGLALGECPEGFRTSGITWIADYVRLRFAADR